MPRKALPLRVHISTLLVVLVVAVGAVIAGIAYSRMSQMLEQSSDRLFERGAQRITSEFERLLMPAGM